MWLLHFAYNFLLLAVLFVGFGCIILSKVRECGVIAKGVFVLLFPIHGVVWLVVEYVFGDKKTSVGSTALLLSVGSFVVGFLSFSLVFEEAERLEMMGEAPGIVLWIVPWVWLMVLLGVAYGIRGLIGLPAKLAARPKKVIVPKPDPLPQTPLPPEPPPTAPQPVETVIDERNAKLQETFRLIDMMMIDQEEKDEMKLRAQQKYMTDLQKDLERNQ